MIGKTLIPNCDWQNINLKPIVFIVSPLVGETPQITLPDLTDVHNPLSFSLIMDELSAGDGFFIVAFGDDDTINGKDVSQIPIYKGSKSVVDFYYDGSGLNWIMTISSNNLMSAPLEAKFYVEQLGLDDPKVEGFSGYRNSLSILSATRDSEGIVDIIFDKPIHNVATKCFYQITTITGFVLTGEISDGDLSLFRITSRDSTGVVADGFSCNIYIQATQFIL